MLSLDTSSSKRGLPPGPPRRYAVPMHEPDPAAEDAARADDARARIIAAAAGLIAAGGRDAATTRAVAAAAAVQAPTIYRLFGDKRGLLDAVAEHGLAAYVAGKSVREPHPDPVQDLRDGWDMHVAFGLAHPGLFAIMSGDARTPPPPPRRGWTSCAAGSGPSHWQGACGSARRAPSTCCTPYASARCLPSSENPTRNAIPACQRQRARRSWPRSRARQHCQPRPDRPEPQRRCAPHYPRRPSSPPANGN